MVLIQDMILNRVFLAAIFVCYYQYALLPQKI
jgi:hypothetical protein